MCPLPRFGLLEGVRVCDSCYSWYSEQPCVEGALPEASPVKGSYRLGVLGARLEPNITTGVGIGEGNVHLKLLYTVLLR